MNTRVLRVVLGSGVVLGSSLVLQSGVLNDKPVLAATLIGVSFALMLVIILSFLRNSAAERNRKGAAYADALMFCSLLTMTVIGFPTMILFSFVSLWFVISVTRPVTSAS